MFSKDKAGHIENGLRRTMRIRNTKTAKDIDLDSVVMKPQSHSTVSADERGWAVWCPVQHLLSTFLPQSQHDHVTIRLPEATDYREVNHTLGVNAIVSQAAIWGVTVITPGSSMQLPDVMGQGLPRTDLPLTGARSTSEGTPTVGKHGAQYARQTFFHSS